MLEKKGFFMKPKHQRHLSQWVEWVYGAQSWKEMRLLCEFVFVVIKRWTLILKNGEKKSFLNETKASMSFMPTRRISFWCPIMERKKIIMWI